jgi:DNA-binding winged helix-turn-helix (wHTH) protein
MTELRLTPQARKVLSHLEKTGWITERSAIMDHSVQRLSARIAELRTFFKDNGSNRTVATMRKKHPITGQRYAKYVLTTVH